jgi:hypothetical protein
MRFLAAALLVHAALLVPLAVAVKRAPSEARARMEAMDLAVEIEEPEEAQVQAQAQAQVQAQAQAQAPPDSRIASRGGAGSIPHDTSPSSIPSPASAAPEPAASGWSPGWLAPKAVDIGLQVGIAYKPSDGPPSPSASPNTGGVREGLDARDHALGLGSGGPVVAVAHGVAMSAPMDHGSAVLEVDADANGVVRSVRVLDVTADAEAWREIAEGIAASLRGKPLHISARAGTRGVVVTLRIEIAMRLPSGAAAGNGKTYALGPGSIGGTFDLADIGAKPKKSVHARVLSERRL